MGYDPKKHHRRSIRLKGYDYTQPGGYFVTMCTQDRQPLFGEIVDGEMRLSEYGEIVREEWFRSAEIRREVRLQPEEFVVMPDHIHGIVWIVDGEEASAGRLAGALAGLGEPGAPGSASGPAISPVGTSTPRSDPAVVAGVPTPETGPAVGAVGAPAVGAVGAPAVGAVGAPTVGAVGAPTAEAVGAPTVGAVGAPTVGAVGAPEAPSAITPAVGAVGAHGCAPQRLQRPARSLGSFVAGFKSATTSRINARRGTPGAPVWQRNYYEHIIRDEESLRRIREYIAHNPLRWELARKDPGTG